MLLLKKLFKKITFRRFSFLGKPSLSLREKFQTITFQKNVFLPFQKRIYPYVYN